MNATGGETLDNLFFDDNSPLTEKEREELLVPADPKEKKPCPICGKKLTWTADGSRPRQHKCKEEAPVTQPADVATVGVVSTISDSLTELFTQPLPAPAPSEKPPLTVDYVVAEYVATRDLIAEKKKAYEKEVEDLENFQTKRAAWLLGKLDAIKVESMRTEHGTVFVDWKDSATVADGEQFFNWVGADFASRKTFLENRVSKSAVKQRLADKQPPPPGINYVKVKDVKVRRA